MSGRRDSAIKTIRLMAEPGRAVSPSVPTACASGRRRHPRPTRIRPRPWPPTATPSHRARAENQGRPAGRPNSGHGPWAAGMAGREAVEAAAAATAFGAPGQTRRGGLAPSVWNYFQHSKSCLVRIAHCGRPAARLSRLGGFGSIRSVHTYPRAPGRGARGFGRAARRRARARRAGSSSGGPARAGPAGDWDRLRGTEAKALRAAEANERR